jgi:hypothetical protein
MFTFYNKEEFKDLNLGDELQLKYAISNYGRLISYTDDKRQGRVLNGCRVEGYKIFRYRIRIDGVVHRRAILFHRMVAENFLVKPSEENIFVIHLDFDKLNNVAENLRFATKEEQIEHIQHSPFVIENKKKLMTRNGQKLTITKAMVLKKRILDPNRKTRLKIIAREFGVSEMALQRMKTGENWSRIKV